MRKKNSTIGIIAALAVILVIGAIYMISKNPADDVGTISGYVKDSFEAPIRGVDVTAIDENGKKHTSHDNTDTTGQDGYFEVELPPGEYTLLFEANDYEPYESSDSYSVKSGENNDISKAFVLEIQTEADALEKDDREISEMEDGAGTTTTVNEPTTTGVAEEKQDVLFTIDPRQIEDYSLNLEPKKYLSYYSDHEGFFFSYPPYLYNRVDSSFTDSPMLLGTNVETHTFMGSEGSTLTFSLISRTDKKNLSSVKDEALAIEGAEITKSKKVLLDEYEKSKGYARVVVTGFDDAGYIIYKLIKVTPSNILEMRIGCRGYKNNDDKLMKRYVQECIYRYCGFAYDKIKEPRSYAEYIKTVK